MSNYKSEADKLESGLRVFGWIVVLTIIGFGCAMTWANIRESKAQFMGECRKDHKQYECDVLWGQAH